MIFAVIFSKKTSPTTAWKSIFKISPGAYIYYCKTFFSPKKNKSFLSLRELTTFSLLQNEKVIKSIQQYFLMVFSLMINVCSKAITVF